MGTVPAVSAGEFAEFLRTWPAANGYSNVTFGLDDLDFAAFVTEAAMALAKLTDVPEARSTPEDVKDGQVMLDRDKSLWQYEGTGDVWHRRTPDGVAILSTASSWHKLVREHGPIVKPGL